MTSSCRAAQHNTAQRDEAPALLRDRDELENKNPKVILRNEYSWRFPRSCSRIRISPLRAARRTSGGDDKGEGREVRLILTRFALSVVKLDDVIWQG